VRPERIAPENLIAAERVFRRHSALFELGSCPWLAV
jgi:hypothetical protein